jgi:hypothetical protein
MQATSLGDLPSNPKTWTPSQLSAYLSTSLRVKSGETLPLPHPVARDIAQSIRERGITGKMFLRLNDADLEECVLRPYFLFHSLICCDTEWA